MVIAGHNGAGKTTFLQLLTGLEQPDSGTIDPGETLVVGYYTQIPFDFRPEQRVIDTITEIAEVIPYGKNESLTPSQFLSKFLFPTAQQYTPVEKLSGGEKKRLQLMRVLVKNPNFLILDEPTNDLDLKTISWLEDFLLDFRNTVIVVSHDRHFLDTVCTHICDIDYSKINMFTGNYSFWYQSSQLATRQRSDKNKKAEEKKKELMEFISRFSANAAKSKQATSRRKMLDNLDLEEIKPSSRRYPGITFHQERDAGNQILGIENLSKTSDGKTLFKDLYLTVNKGDKIAFISRDSVALTHFFEIMAGNLKADTGEITFGTTITTAYLPNDNHHYFEAKLSLINWLRQYALTDEEREEVYLRTFLGRMLFTGEEAMKMAVVLSGGEKVRCMLSKMMLAKGNLLLMDEPTNHLDLESITALNNAMQEFQGTLLFTSHDHELVSTVANRIIELTPNGVIDKMMPYDDYLADDKIAQLQAELYA